MEKDFSRPDFVEAKIVCRSCGQEVAVTLLAFGRGYVAVCPKCNKLAYNGEALPELQ